MTRLTFDTVLSAYEQKGYSIEKKENGYHVPYRNKNFKTLKLTLDYLETLPDRTTPTVTATPTVMDRQLSYYQVWVEYQNKGYSIEKKENGYHVSDTKKKLKNLKLALDYLETLPDRTMPTVTATPTEIEVPTVTEVSITEPNQKSDTIPKPQELFNTIIKLDNPLDVARTCNEFLDAISSKWATSTISKKLTEYKKPFYQYQHPTNPALNETVETAKGSNTQHIAARLLSLNDEQKETLGFTRSESDNARAGFDAEGELRGVEKPPVDITAIIQKSTELLSSSDPHSIGVGIILLTGLRANEQNMPGRYYPQWNLLIERDMVVVDEYLIAFKGISKKPDRNDAESYFTRVTLAPAQLIIDAQNRFKSSPTVQAIPTDYERYRKGFQDAFSNKFTELFRTDLSTIEAYDDNGKLTEGNGTPHKGRAFYACALRSILKDKAVPDVACNSIIQQCLAHESSAITAKYLGRYDDKDFVNAPNIPIPTNIKKLGKTNHELIETLKPKPVIEEIQSLKTEDTDVTNPANDFDMTTFIDGLDADKQIQFGELINSGMTLTEALWGMINDPKTAMKEKKKKAVTDEIAEISEAIAQYNRNQTDIVTRVVPTYTLFNKIGEKLLGKTFAKKTFDDWQETNKNKLIKELEETGISLLEIGTWNGKNHRKTMDSVIDSVIAILKEQ